MDEREATRFLERAARFGIHPSLDGIRRLTDALGRPQDSFDAVQVAGTNGKTSVTRLAGAILHGEGRSVGVFTSPRLDAYREQIAVDGEMIGAAEFGRVVSRVATADAATGAEAATEFELMTAAALLAFAERQVDHACLEVGLGGRWDATSVVEPRVAVIASIGIDHVAQLGDDPWGIARDKAHIIRSGSMAVVGPAALAYATVFEQRALEVGATLVRVGESSALVETGFRLVEQARGLTGGTLVEVQGLLARYTGLRVPGPSYQAANSAVAIVAAEGMLGRPLDVGVLRRTLAGMRFPGRFEVLPGDPPVILDGSHNPQAAQVLARAVADALPAGRVVTVLAVLADKDAAGIVRALEPVTSEWVVSATRSPRALPAEKLASLVARESHKEIRVVPSVEAAVDEALRIGADAVLVTGSLTTVDPARAALADRG